MRLFVAKRNRKNLKYQLSCQIKWLLLFAFIVASKTISAQAPVAQFTANNTTGCVALVVQFTDQSTGNPVFWNWDLGNGQLSTLQNPTAVYTTPGTYTITLVVRNATGINSITKTDYIVANPAPQANFTADNQISCIPAVVQFTDLSVPNAGTIVSWDWDFGDGTRSTLQNPQKTYNAIGFYPVSLRVTSSTGCQSLIGMSNYIRVVSGVTPEFSNTAPITCSAPFVIDFTDLTSGPGNLTYQWDFGNSTGSTQQSPTATYAAPGTYTVRLTSTSEYGCSGSIQRDIVIPSTTTSFNSPDSVCLNSVINFQNTSSPIPESVRWDFGNGMQSTKVDDTSSYSVAGTYIVKLVNTNANCTDSISRNIFVRPNPTVDFTAANTISCRAPFVVNFQDISPNAVSWQWNFGDGGTSTQQNPSHQYNTEGQFNVTLTIVDDKGCTNNIVKSSFVRIIKPTLAVTNAPAGGCLGFTYSPIPAVNAIDGIASYFWDFGDGFTSTAINPSHIYAAVGSYTLKFVITTTGGCRDSVVYTNGIRVGTSPNANFTAAPLDVCPSENVNFTIDPSTIADQWNWNFGDGSLSSVQNPVHAYLDSGYFSVTLTAFNNGCPQTVSRNLYIHVKPPIARFTYSVNCNNKRVVTFANTSKTDIAYGPVSYSWNFGDGNTSSSISPTHTYASTGNYSVSLSVTNGSCTNLFTQAIALNSDIADFSISKSTVCRNESFTLTAINSLPANIVIYQWSFDGGPFNDLGRVVTTSFNSVGPHTIALIITDVNGCTDTKVVDAAVTVVGPTANFTSSSAGACRNSVITFNDLSTPGNISQWNFDFGDGSQQSFTAPPFTHNYADTGLFIVRLTVRDVLGCSDTFSLPGNIHITRPVAKFSAASTLVCPGASVQFADSSSGYNLNYTWWFGDGNSSTLKNPTHIYSGVDSSYTVKLVIRDTVGCSDSLTLVNYIVIRTPKPAFDIKDTTSICPPLETRFTFLGQDYESFYWDFGDGSTSTLTNPTHFYNAYGSYTPKLYLVGYGGCIDSAASQVNVYNPALYTSLIYGPVTACNSLLVDFTITAPPSTRFTFLGGDGFVDSSQTKVFSHLYPSFGYFTPTVLIQDTLKCVVNIGGTTQIRILGAEPLFGVDNKSFCDSSTVLFANYTIGNDSVISSVWDFGDGIISTTSDPSHLYDVPGTYLPSLTVNTQAGCSKTLNDTIRVYGTPNPFINGDSIVCINEQLLLQGSLAVPDTAIAWNWSFGNGFTSNLQNPSTLYNRDGSYILSLIASNKLGCKDTVTRPVMVPPNPVITVLNNPVIPVGTSITLPISYSPNVSTYNWTPPLALSCADCPTPVATPKSTTKYRVTATDIYGCTSNNEVTVVVVCNDKNFFIPNTFSPNNDGNNDVFYPRGNGIARIQSMRIFNRWGEMVFQRTNFAANDPSMGWDGTYKGRKGDIDAYVYVIELICENSVVIPYRGNVTLIR